MIVIDSFIFLFQMLPLFSNTFLVVRHILREKRTNMRNRLRSMDIGERLYILSWLEPALTTSVLSIVLYLVAGFVFQQKISTNIDIFISFLFLWLIDLILLSLGLIARNFLNSESELGNNKL